MAEQRQPNPKRGGNRGQAPNTVLLNPERVPQLLPKWQKLIGKDLEKIEVIYEENGVTVHLWGKGGTPYHLTDAEGASESMSVPEYRRIHAAANAATEDESLRAFKNKFELRLNLPFPQNAVLPDASEASIGVFLQTLPFNQRRAMLMSNKQFKSAYPNGFTGA